MFKRFKKYIDTLESRIELDFIQNNLCNADWVKFQGVLGRIARSKYFIVKR